MTSGEDTKPVDVGGLLDEILADAQSDDEQLWALQHVISGALELPADVHVVGEPLVLVAVDYHSNPRRGLVARCRRDDGCEYRVAFADIEMRAGAQGARYLAAYRTWLGVEPAVNVSTVAPRAQRRHKANEEDLDLSKPVELVVLAVKERAARCRLLASERVITLRAGSLHRVVAGQIATVQPNKHWRHAGYPYLSGKIVAIRIDAAALGLAPLELRRSGDWDPAAEIGSDPPFDEWITSIIAGGPCPAFEMELPGSDPEKLDPIIEANLDVGDLAGAGELAAKLLETDLRYLDAHTHLANRLLRLSPQWALHHHEVGVRIGELSVGDEFEGVLPWSLVGNRPILRCLLGYGTCLWRLERWDEAEHVFARIVRLDPSDHQGLRSLLPAVRAREPWIEGEVWR